MPSRSSFFFERGHIRVNRENGKMKDNNDEEVTE